MMTHKNIALLCLLSLLSCESFTTTETNTESTATTYSTPQAAEPLPVEQPKQYLLNVKRGSRRADQNLSYFIPLTLTSRAGMRAVGISVICASTGHRQKIRVNIKPNQTKTVEVYHCPVPNESGLSIALDNIRGGVDVRVEDVIFADGSVRSNEY